jgi:hypothetical protein
VVGRQVVAREGNVSKVSIIQAQATYLISESLPAHARKVSSWLFGWLIHALKKLHSPRDCARAFASLYTGSNLQCTVLNLGA